MYADFHCYPGKVAYNSSVMALDGVDKLPLNPWQIPQSNLEEQRRGRQARGYSQCDLVKSTQARVKLMFASLYPIEKGYFYGNSAGLICKQIIRDYFNRIHADGEDLAFVKISVVDKDGNLVPDADNMLHFKLSGNGEIRALDNGYQADLEPYTNKSYRKAFNGLGLAIIQSNKQKGKIALQISSEGLQGAGITMESK